MLTNNRADLWAVREKGDWLHKIDRTPVQLTSGPLNFEASQTQPGWEEDLRGGFAVQVGIDAIRRKDGSISRIPRRNFGGGPDGLLADRKWVAYLRFRKDNFGGSRVDGSERLQLTAPSSSAALYPVVAG